MKNSNEKIVLTLIQRYIATGIANTVLFKELDKIDIKISKRIIKKFTPKSPPKSQLTSSEYFDAVIKKLACQILIGEEIRNEIQKIYPRHTKNLEVIRKNLRKIDAIKEKNR